MILPGVPTAVCAALLLATGADSAAQQQKWTSERYASPLVSPDGKSILIEATIPPRNAEVFVSRADGSELRNLTRHPAEDIGARWSPDGRSILFRSDRDGVDGLYRMNADGSDVRRIAAGLTMLAAIDWSPDGQRVAYAGREGVMVVAADGAPGPQLLVSKGSNPIWSPDGRWILYESGGPANREVHVVPADGGPDRKIADGWAIAWSPDSGAVVYLSHASRVHPNLAHVYLVGADGSGRTQLFSDVLPGGRPEDPARLWSPDGGRLALAMADVGGLRPREGIVVVDRKGRVVRDLRKHDWFHYGETLSWRDERTIVLSKIYNPPSIETRLAGDPGGIYLLDVESGQERRIIGDKEILVDPRKPPW